MQIIMTLLTAININNNINKLHEIGQIIFHDSNLYLFKHQLINKQTFNQCNESKTEFDVAVIVRC